MKSSKMRVFLVFMFVLMMGFGIGFRLSRAEDSTVKTANTNEVGNKICPISGEKIHVGKEHKVEYKGKIYSLCCSMCEKDFKKDPEAAIKKIEAMKDQEELEEGTDMDADGDDGDSDDVPQDTMPMENQEAQ